MGGEAADTGKVESGGMRGETAEEVAGGVGLVDVRGNGGRSVTVRCRIGYLLTS